MLHLRLNLLARSLVALLFIVAGVRKVLHYDFVLGYFGSLGLPMPEIVLPATITLELVCGVALIMGWKLRWVIPVLGLFCLGTAVIAHDFWNAGAAQYDAQLNNFLKNLAIAGGFLTLALWTNEKEPVPGVVA